MPQNPLLTDQIHIEPGSVGSRVINRSQDGSLLLTDPSVSARLRELVGIRNVTGLYLVGRGGDGAPYTSIQDALDAIPNTSSPDEPSVVVVTGGEYVENLTINKDGVFLIGLGGVTLRNDGAASTLTISDTAATTPTKVVLQNLRVVNEEPGQACIEVVGAGAFASGSVTVNTAPLAPTDAVLIGGVALVGVSGVRDSGSDNFSVDGGTPEAIAAEITEAINDPDNSFAASVVATFSGVDVNITAATPGAGGNTITLTVSTTPPGGLSVSGPNLTGGSSAGSPVAFDGLDILGCDLVAEGVGGFQILADTVNNIRVAGGSWSGSSSTSICRVVQCAQLHISNVEWVNDLELAYDAGSDQPLLVTSEYQVRYCSRVGDSLSNLVGEGSLSFAFCPEVGNITAGGDRALDILYSGVQDLSLQGTTASRLVHTTRGSATVAGGSPTLEEPSTGAVAMVASVAEAVTFDVSQPDASYVVLLETPDLATSFAVTAKDANGFTVSSAPAYTGTVSYSVLRRS